MRRIENSRSVAFAYFIQGLEYKRVGNLKESYRSLREAIERGCEEAQEAIKEVQDEMLNRNPPCQGQVPPKDSHRLPQEEEHL